MTRIGTASQPPADDHIDQSFREQALADLHALYDEDLDACDRSRLLRALRSDPELAAQADAMRRVVDELKNLPEAPDLTKSVMARIELETPFLPARGRRRLKRLRLAAASSVLCFAIAGVIAARCFPGLIDRPGAITHVFQAGATGVQSGARDVSSLLSDLRGVPRPGPSAETGRYRDPRTALSFGPGLSRYDAPPVASLLGEHHLPSQVASSYVPLAMVEAVPTPCPLGGVCDVSLSPDGKAHACQSSCIASALSGKACEHMQRAAAARQAIQQAQQQDKAARPVLADEAPSRPK
ncbi:MAG: hypothetical protein SFZ23_12730 [Planctomycetota bacterium]|nr:hypothetical protein [Planctomycetota bacterium]